MRPQTRALCRSPLCTNPPFFAKTHRREHCFLRAYQCVLRTVCGGATPTQTPSVMKMERLETPIVLGRPISRKTFRVSKDSVSITGTVDTSFSFFDTSPVALGYASAQADSVPPGFRRGPTCEPAPRKTPTGTTTSPRLVTSPSPRRHPRIPRQFSPRSPGLTRRFEEV